MKDQVVIVGSLSVDFVMRVPRRPQKGETIAGYDFNTFVGGKGNNQALAAARAGARTTMIGCVGKDIYGDRIESTLRQSGADTSNLSRLETEGTGIANIYVDPEGDNSIVIVPRANGKLSPKLISEAAAAIQQAKIVLLQLEIPVETVGFAANAAKKAGATVILNPAPAPPTGIADSVLECVDIIVPNEIEAQLLTGMKTETLDEAKQAAAALQKRGPNTVILTLGERGALVAVKGETPYLVQPFKVKAVDTPAAGDAFCGAMAAALSVGQSMRDAVRFGCAAGALACTIPGAEPSLPTKQAIENLVGAPTK
jgi:ribokinase